MSILIACTECGKKLSVRDELKGKKVKCPGCATVFTASSAAASTSVSAKTPKPAPAAPSRDQVSTKPMPKRAAPPPLDDDDQTEGRAASARRQRDRDDEDERPAGSRGKHRKKAAGANLLGLWIGLAAFIVIGGGIGAYFMFFRESSGPGAGVAQGKRAAVGDPKQGGQAAQTRPAASNLVDMVPGDAIVFASLAFDINQGNWAKHKLPPEIGEMARKMSGIPLEDFERVSVFSVAMPADEKPGDPPPFVILVQTKRPVDRPAVQAAEILKNPGLAVEFVNDQTLIVGPQTMLQLYKTKLGKTKATGVLERALGLAAKLKVNTAVASAVIPPDVAQMAQAPGPNAPPMLAMVAPFLKAKGVLLTAEASDRFALEITATMGDPKDAKEVHDATIGMVGLGQALLAGAPKDQQTQQFVQLATLALNGLKITMQGNDVTAALQLDAKTLEVFTAQVLQAAAKMQGAAAASLEMNNLKQISLAWHGYHDRSKTLPPQSFGKGLSWRVMILPYLEQESLFREFNLNEAWDSPHNKSLIAKMPKVFESTTRKNPPGQTFFQSFVGPNTVNPVATQGLKLTSIPDGTSNTLIVAEAEVPVEWTRPADIAVTPIAPIGLGASSPNGSLAAFADGSVRYIPRTIPQQILRWLIDPADGNVIPNF